MEDQCQNNSTVETLLFIFFNNVSGEKNKVFVSQFV